MMFVKVRQDGSVNIPAALRRKYSITPGTWFEVTGNGKGKLTFSTRRVTCSLCGAHVKSVDSVTGTCIFCKDALTTLVRQGMSLSYALRHLQKQRQSGNF